MDKHGLSPWRGMPYDNELHDQRARRWRVGYTFTHTHTHTLIVVQFYFLSNFITFERVFWVIQINEDTHAHTHTQGTPTLRRIPSRPLTWAWRGRRQSSARGPDHPGGLPGGSNGVVKTVRWWKQHWDVGSGEGKVMHYFKGRKIDNLCIMIDCFADMRFNYGMMYIYKYYI